MLHFYCVRTWNIKCILNWGTMIWQNLRTLRMSLNQTMMDQFSNVKACCDIWYESHNYKIIFLASEMLLFQQYLMEIFCPNETWSNSDVTHQECLKVAPMRNMSSRTTKRDHQSINNHRRSTKFFIIGLFHQYSSQRQTLMVFIWKPNLIINKYFSVSFCFFQSPGIFLSSP